MPDENENKLTTIQIDQETSRKLALVAQAHERNKASQVRYWVNREYAELERLKLLPVASLQSGDYQSIQD